jgi:tRNA1Val (adenine37-N6)-methyltransferase
LKPFHFKKFSINQSKDVFRVGTDGVLLGAMCSAENAKNILEVGTGTGLISLMIAQRNPKANILALFLSVAKIINFGQTKKKISSLLLKFKTL